MSQSNQSLSHQSLSHQSRQQSQQQQQQESSLVPTTGNAFDYIDAGNDGDTTETIGLMKWYCPPPPAADADAPPPAAESRGNEDDGIDATRRGWWKVVPSPSEGGGAGGAGGAETGGTAPSPSPSPSKTTTTTTTTTKLYLAPPAKRDFWRKTYYEPLLVKDDAPFLFRTIDAAQASLPLTVETSFTIHNSKSQFDQAGLMVRIDHEHWVKAGIEIVDKIPRLSCVVTNGFSDWSTQAWNCDTPEILVRVHVLPRRHGRSVVVEAAEKRKQQPATSRWSFVRIAHLNQNMNHDLLNDHPATKNALLPQGEEQPNLVPPPPRPPKTDPSSSSSSTASTASTASTSKKKKKKEKKMMVGVFGACPVDQTGMYVVFDYLSIRQGSDFVHDAN